MVTVEALEGEGRGPVTTSAMGDIQYPIIHIVVIVCCRMIPPVILLGKCSHLGGLLPDTRATYST